MGALARWAEVGHDRSKLTKEEQKTLDYWRDTFEKLQKAFAQIDGEVHLNGVDSSLAEPKERIDFYNEFSEKLKEGQEDNEERGRYDSGRTRNGSEQGDEGTGDNRPVGGNDDISRNAIQMGEQRRRLREIVEYAKRRAEALAAELEATKRENEQREAAGLEKRKPRALSEDNPWQEGDFDPPLNVDLLDEAERRQRRILERADAVPEATAEERKEIESKGKRVDAVITPLKKMYWEALKEYGVKFGKKCYAAPNGKPSNLPDDLWVTVRTKAFKEWFGDWENDPENASAVLDENGEPRIVFHGPRTIKKFARFIGGRINAMFFSDDYAVARAFNWNSRYKLVFNGDKEVWLPEELHSIFLEKIGNNDYTLEEILGWGTPNLLHLFPSRIAAEDEFLYKILPLVVSAGIRSVADVRSVRLERGSEVMPVFLNIRNPMRTDFQGDVWNSDYTLNFDERFVDGHIVKDIQEGGIGALTETGAVFPIATDYIVKNPKAIKSVFNKGTFSKRTSDIYRRLKEAERRQRRILEKVHAVPAATPDERAEIAARGKRVSAAADGYKYYYDPHYGQILNERRRVYRDVLVKKLGLPFTFGREAYAAPNGKPSNLPDELWITVRTKAFKEWFGDWENDPKHASVVLDENGEPLIVFHGPRDVFSVFRVPKELKDTDEFNYRLDAVFFLRNGKTQDLRGNGGGGNVKCS